MKQHILSLSSIFLLAFSSVCHGANRASFDCEKASTPTEKCICGDSDLSRIDRGLASEYRTRLEFLSPEEKNKLKAEQKAWLEKRDKSCKQSEGTSSNTYGIDKDCLKEMYQERIDALDLKIPNLSRLDLNPPEDLKKTFLKSGNSIGILEPDGIPNYREYYYRLSDHEYILPINNVQGRMQFGIYYVDTKQDLFDQITGGGSSIVGAIQGKGITWLITYHSDLIHGVMSEGYNAIMIKDKKPGERPYQVFDLASISTSDSSETDCDKTNPCICLSNSEEDAENSFYALKGYDVKDLNGDGINDMVFHIELIDCEANKRISIKETYYFLSKEPFIEKKEEKSFIELPAFSPRIGHSFWIASVTFSPDGRYALSGSWDGTMKLWDVATGKEIRTFKEDDDVSVHAVAISRDGRYALSGRSGGLKLWNVVTGEKIRSFDGHRGIESAVAFSPDGRYALSGGSVSDNNALKLWDVATGKEIRTFESVKLAFPAEIRLGSVDSVAFSPDGRYALSVSFNRGEMMLWDVATGKGIRTFSGHSGVVESVAFSPNGRYALSGSGDRTIKLWDIATGKEIRTFTGHSEIVKSVAFSPDGRYALSGSGDKTIKLWDIATGKEIRTFTGHSEVVNSVAFSPDGRYVLSGSNDVTLRLWDATTGKEIRTFGHPPYIK
jgi:WD40 repeat protein/uncharacterized protein YecT (DUF1311 family)